jgi:hypothetical protein
MIYVTSENFYWFLIADGVAVYLVYWAVEWVWKRYVDWYIARNVVRRRLYQGLGDTSSGKRTCHRRDQTQTTNRHPPGVRHSLLSAGRAMA